MVLFILKSREINETQDTEDKKHTGTKAEYVFLIISYTLPFTTSKSSIVAGNSTSYYFSVSPLNIVPSPGCLR